jgi:hypothetical protein
MFGIDDIISVGMKLLDKVIPDPAAKAAAQLELMKLTQNGQLAELQAETTLATNQTDVNKVEASSTSLFVSGWRPFIGWVCGAACAWNWIGISLAKTVCAIAHYQIELAPASLTEMMPILLGMLGLGAYRTYEKTQGVAAK